MAEEHVNNSEAEKTASETKKLQPAILENFTKLTKDKDKFRIEAGVNIVKYFRHNEFDEKNEIELKYALKRLVRGLGSNRTSARIGFYTTLVALLKVNENITFKLLHEIAKNELQTSGSDSKGEKGEIYSGQVLLSGAIVRSGLFVRSSAEEQRNVLKMLLDGGNRRSYLALIANTFLFEILEEVNEKDFKKFVLPHMSDLFGKIWEDINALHFLCEAQNKFPNVINKKYLKKYLDLEEIICNESLEKLCNLLVSSDLETSKHPFFEKLSKTISKSDYLQPFLTTLNTNLEKHNQNKLINTTKLLKNLTEYLPTSSAIPNLFIPNYIHHTLNHLRSLTTTKTDALHQNLVELFNTITTAFQLSEDNDAKLSFLKKLLFNPGTLSFEQIARVKVVQQVALQLDGESTKRLAEMFIGVAFDESKRFTDRIYGVQMFVKCLGCNAVQKELDWRVAQLIRLVDVGVFDGGVKEDLARFFRQSFYQGLDNKFRRLEDMKTVFASIYEHCIERLDGNTLTRKPLAPETLELLQKTSTIIKKLSKKPTEVKSVFSVLFSHLGLQLFENVELASDALNELFSCHEHIKTSSDDEPLWIEVIVDLFLSLLSHNSHLLRNVVTMVFPHLCKYLNASAVHQVLTVLDPVNDEDLMEVEDEEEDEESVSEEELDEEEETVNEKLRMAVRSALHTNGYQTDDESVDLDDVTREEGEKLDDALSAAFKQYVPNKGKNKKQSKQSEALMHFRMRVLDLLEIYIESTPSLSLCLELMLPLLKLLEYGIRDPHQASLADRVRSVFKKLTSVKKIEYDDSAGLADLFSSLLERGSKTSMLVHEMGDKIADCCVFLVKCSANEAVDKTTKKQIQKRLLEALHDFFQKRDSLIPFSLFKGVVELKWKGNKKFIPQLVKYAFDDDIRSFRKSQSVTLLQTFYQKTKEPIAITELSDSVIDVFVSERNSKGSFVVGFFNLLVILKRNGFELNWERIGELVQEYRKKITLSTDARISYNKLCGVLGLVATKKDKSESKEVIREVEEAQTVEKEKKKSKATAKEGIEKKKKKILRLENSSKGLEGVSFAGMEVEEEERSNKRKGDETNGEVKKKRKMSNAFFRNQQLHLRNVC